MGAVYQGTTLSEEMGRAIELISKLGPTGAIVLFGIIVTWRALPTLLRWWGAQIRQANTVAQAVPDMNAALQSMAANGEASHSLLQEMNKKLDKLLTRR